MSRGTKSPEPQKPSSVEEQLTEVYALVDELHHVETRLRSAVTAALHTFKGENRG